MLSDHNNGSHCPAGGTMSIEMNEQVIAKKHGLTDDEAGQVEDVPTDREAEGTRDRHTVRLEEYAVRVHGLGRVLERVRGKVLPVLDYARVLEEL
jgi:hypothetical protein